MSLWLLAIGLILATPAAAEQLVGRALTIDGDTLRVGGVAVRLQGVAAPEGREAGGAAATAYMRRLVDGQTVVCQLTRERSWGRRVGVCRRAGRDVGAAVIEAGLARDCPRYSGGRYAAIEQPKAAGLPFPGYCRPTR